MSISSTFYIFLYKSALRSFSLIKIRLCNFLRKNIGAKATCKTLMKLTILLNSVFTCFQILTVKLECLHHIKTKIPSLKWPSLAVKNDKLCVNKEKNCRIISRFLLIFSGLLSKVSGCE